MSLYEPVVVVVIVNYFLHIKNYKWIIIKNIIHILLMISIVTMILTIHYILNHFRLLEFSRAIIITVV